MKKLFFIIICIVAYAFAPAVINASATLSAAPSVTYARAAVSDGYFFTRKDTASSVFAVPYTYCVEVLRDDGDGWYYVRYAEDNGIYRALYGYVLKEDFVVLSEKPEVTYLYKSITVTYRADEGSTSLPVLSQINVDAAFYGTYYAGATAYSYVLCQNSFGYVVGANDDYPLNLPDEPDRNEHPEEKPEEDNVGARIVTAVILIAVAAGALAVLFFATRKKGKLSS